MSARDIQELYEYGHWANRRLPDALSALSDDEFTRNIAGSYGQILRHGAIHSAHHRGQASLLCRMLGHAPGNFDALFYYAGDITLR